MKNAMKYTKIPNYPTAAIYLLLSNVTMDHVLLSNNHVYKSTPVQPILQSDASIILVPKILLPV